MVPLQVNDKRKFNCQGEPIAPETETEAAIKPSISAFQLADIPRTYENDRPIKDYVLVKQNAAATTFAGTVFHIPESVQQSPNQGVIVAVGPKVTECGLGDVVTFGRYNAEALDVDGETYQLVNENDIKLVAKVHYAHTA